MVLRWISQDSPGQPKLYLEDQRQYIAGLRNIPIELHLQHVIRNWRPLMEEDPSSSDDYEAGIVWRNPKLMCFQISRRDGFFATDAERLDACISDTYYT